MADPKVGYSPGVYRLVQGTVDAAGDFSATNVPKEGFVPGIYKLTQVTVDASGDLSATSEDRGVKRSIIVTVDASGDISETNIPQIGYVPGLYRVTTSTNTPKEGFIDTFTTDVGDIVSGIWEASVALLLMESGDTLLLESGDSILLD